MALAKPREKAKLHSLSSLSFSLADLSVEKAAKKLLSYVSQITGCPECAFVLLQHNKQKAQLLSSKGLTAKQKQVLAESKADGGKITLDGLGAFRSIPLKGRNSTRAYFVLKEPLKNLGDEFELVCGLANFVLLKKLNETEVSNSYLSMATSLAKLVDARDHYTFGHSRAVHDYAMVLGEEAGLNQADLSNLSIAAFLHDVGKAGIGDDILLKKGPLTQQEFAYMKTHPLIGARILEGIENFSEVVPMVMYHHEHFNGHGYPAGLKGPKIPIGARILCVADIFDALTSNRPYRKSLTIDDAIAVMKKESAKTVDPDLFNLFLSCFANKPVISTQFSMFNLLAVADDAEQEKITSAINSLLNNISNNLLLFTGNRMAKKIIGQINDFSVDAHLNFKLSLLGVAYVPSDRSSSLHLVKTFETFYSFIQTHLTSTLGLQVSDKILTSSFKKLPKSKLATCIKAFPAMLLTKGLAIG